MVSRKHLNTIGWREWVTFPELGLGLVKAKVDTGARSSSLHAVEIDPFKKKGQDWVRFEVHPEQRTTKNSVICDARILDRRTVRSSNGREELRFFIRTEVSLGGDVWPIELTLTSRANMGFRLLLGREAMRRRFVVDPARSYVFGNIKAKNRKAQLK